MAVDLLLTVRTLTAYSKFDPMRNRKFLRKPAERSGETWDFQDFH